MKDKKYYAKLKLELDYCFDAKNKKEAIEYLKDNFWEDFGLKLEDSEIIKLEEAKWIHYLMCFIFQIQYLELYWWYTL